jgi:hypothetical protein
VGNEIRATDPRRLWEKTDGRPKVSAPLVIYRGLSTEIPLVPVGRLAWSLAFSGALCWAFGNAHYLHFLHYFLARTILSF